MNLLICPGMGPHANHEPTLATGREADQIRQELDSVKERYESAYSIHGRARSELIDSFLDARAADWDGYAGMPVSDVTYRRARQFLDRCLSQFPVPSISASPSGALVFEWSTASDRRFMSNVSEDRHVAFAGVFGEDSHHGTAVFIRDLPRDVIDGLQRLFPR